VPSDDPPPEDFDYGERREDGQYERHPTTDEGEFAQPVRDTYVHTEGCGSNTTMGSDLAESFARDPHQYGKTFCAGCGDYYPLDEFTWKHLAQPLDEVGPPVAGERVRIERTPDTVQAYAPAHGVKQLGDSEQEAVAELRTLLEVEGAE
jgi:hypothetical protein